MTGRKHRYNIEVVAQGVANIASAILDGISVIGMIAYRDRYSPRACSPVSGMAHAVVVLEIMLVAAPLASLISLYRAASPCTANGRTRIPVGSERLP